jgi:hypothetical protein
MFLDHFTETQKRCFLNLANRVILADWLVPPAEQSLLMALAEELGPSVTVDAKSLWGKVDLTPFHERTLRVVLVFELFLVAEADDIVCRGEEEVIAEVATELGLDNDTQAHLRHLAHEQHIANRADLTPAERAPRRDALARELGLT